MRIEIPPTSDSRRMLTSAFAAVPRIDIGIDCGLEGTAGAFYRDESSRSFLLAIPPFHYFAGDPSGDGAKQLLRSLPRRALIMPSAAGWFERARDIRHPHSTTRFRFATGSLDRRRLESLLAASPYCRSIQPISLSEAEAAAAEPAHLLDLSHFRSPEDFLHRGIGFRISEKGRIIGVAYSSLACTGAIEASLEVHPQHRKMGVGTVLAAALLRECLNRGVRPNWDAANLISSRMGEKLGLISQGTYEALVV